MNITEFESDLEEAVNLFDKSLPSEMLRDRFRQFPIIIEEMPSDPLPPGSFAAFISIYKMEHVEFYATNYLKQVNFCEASRENRIKALCYTLYHELGHAIGLSEERIQALGKEKFTTK